MTPSQPTPETAAASLNAIPNAAEGDALIGKPHRYHLATFGCQMNEYDSNLIGSMLEGRGLASTDDALEADLVVVNTCSIRGGAEERARARIASMRHLKRRRPDVRIAVVGCMAQNQGEALAEELEHVDFVVGPDNYKALEEKLFSGSARTEGAALLLEQDPFENYQGMTAKLQSAVSTHVTIMRGCNKQCSYCIVPLVRGKERSRDAEDVLAEVRGAVEQGVKEVCLLGQTVNSYRTATDSFATLLRRLQEVDGLERVRFTSPHPRHFDAETIRAMAECPKVCNHVHLPLQSGSDVLLKAMRRQYDMERYYEIVAALRDALPEVALTTDIITGYVGETEADYEATLEAMRRIRFDHAYMFSYSPREGTPAFGLAETLTPEQKQARLEGVIELQMGITEAKLDSLLGREFAVLLEGPSPRDAGEWIGKTTCFRKTVVARPSGAAPGQTVRTRIVGRKGLVLKGVEVPA